MTDHPPVAALRGRILTGDHVLADGVVVLSEGHVARLVDAREYDGPTEPVDLVAPGLVDVHCHGGDGASFTSGDAEQVSRAAQFHRSRGTTTLIASTVADDTDRLICAVAVLADAVESGAVAGIHLEGPFLSEQHCGAQDPRHLRDPDPALLDELLAAGRGHVRMMTLAPELPGAIELADQLRGAGVVAAVGHTTADLRTTRAALAGGGHVTHLFNGMPPLHHRTPGPVGAALEGQATVELIGDGVHVADEIVTTLLRLLPSRVCLISDAMPAAGMPDGRYRLGPQEVEVTDGVARLVGGGSIAGSTAALGDIVARHASDVPDHVLLDAATSTPATALGLEAGRLRPGARADLVVLDAGLHVSRTMRAGRWVEKTQ